jgi:SAM-dependent MidA family methyltransferase
MASYHSEARTLAQLPPPTADEIAHSNRLVDFLIAEMERYGGIISFHDYMQFVLYQPGLGYYSAGLSKFGAGGDFVTAPEISNLFGSTLGRQCELIFEQGCARNILEFGAGSGRLCAQILASLKQGCAYSIIELSADLRLRQQEYLQSCLSSEVFHQLRWLDQLPTEFSGIVLGNEVLDAMPVHLVSKDQQWYELGVEFDGKSFKLGRVSDQSQAVSAIGKIESTHGLLASGYTTEVNLNYRPWLNALRECCKQAVVLMIDYGYEQAQYYHPERGSGTLVCHYRHRSHADALVYPGLQDITASVDFDAYADAAIDCDFKISGYSSQGQFLLSGGLLEEAESAVPGSDTMGQLGLAQQIKTLTLPTEMGERFKVIGLHRNLDIDIPAFTQGR